MDKFCSPFVLVSVGFVLFMGCNSSNCDDLQAKSSDTFLVQCNGQRIPMVDMKPFALDFSVPEDLCVSNHDVPLGLTKILFEDQTIENPLAQLFIPKQSKLEVALDPSVFAFKRGGPVHFEVMVNHWQGQTKDPCRFYIQPKLTKLTEYTYVDISVLSPISLEMTQLLTDNHPTLFVQEYKKFTHQLSRYDLNTIGTNVMLTPSTSFTQIQAEALDAFITLTHRIGQDNGLVYSEDITNLAALPLPNGPRNPAPKSIPGSTLSHILGMRAIPLTEKFFMTGLVASNPVIQSFSYDSTSTPGIFHEGTQQVFIPNLHVWATRSINVPRRLDLDIKRSFDAIVLDKQNQVTLLRHGLLPSDEDKKIASQATQAIARSLGNIPAAAVALADLDDDGLQDVIVAQGGPGSLLFAAQQEDGTFLPAKPIGDILQYVKDIAVGDMDGDGLLDIAVATDNKLTVYRNISRN